MVGRNITTITGGFDADETGVDRFVEAMRRKLNKKRKQGRGGWNLEPYTVQADRGERTEYLGCSVADLKEMLEDHLQKGDVVDIANFCMMIWNREHPTGRHDD